MFESTVDFGIKISTVTKLSWSASTHKVPARNLHALVYRIKGTASFVFDNGTNLVTKEKEILYCPSGVGYNVCYDDGEIIVFHFYADGLPSLPETQSLPYTERVESLFEDALRVWNDHENGYYYKVLSILFEVLSVCSVRYNKTRYHRPEYVEACDYLKNNVYDPHLSISEVCRMFMISETGFRKFFGGIYGISPVKYINEMRIRESEWLLISTNLTIENIAYNCGFNDVKYFSRVFSSYCGCSPSKYRKY